MRLRGSGRFILPQNPQHLEQAGLHPPLAVEGRAADEQFIQQDAEAVDITAGIRELPDFRLLRAHVRGLGIVCLLRRGR